MNAKIVVFLAIPFAFAAASGGGDGASSTVPVSTPGVTDGQATTPQVTVPIQSGGNPDKTKTCVKNPSGLLDVNVFCDVLCASSGCITCNAVCLANAKVLNLCNVNALVTAIAAVCPKLLAADVCAKACACCDVLGRVNLCVNTCLKIGIVDL